MAKQEINLGSAPNAGDGDPLRTAFNKINENFTELYNSTGGLDLASITESIIPSVDNTYNLGSPSKRWQHGYFATGSLYVGDIKISNDNGTLLVQQVTDAGLITEEPVPDAPGVVTTDRIINGANTFAITAAGELELNGDPFTGGSGSGDRLTNGLNEVILNSDGSLSISGAVRIATNEWGNTAFADASTVIYTATVSDLASIRVHASIEGYEDGDTTGYHTQACDMMIVRRISTLGVSSVDSVVYGVIYTGAGPLATLDAQWNAVTSKIEITATPVSTTNNVFVKIYATEVVRGD